MVHGLILALLIALLARAAFEDVRTRRLPNRLTAGVALLYPLHVLASPTPVAWPAALAVATALFAVGAALFAWRLLGGGDVKLIAALGLWSGPEHLAAFAAATALSGGALALAYLWYERWGWFVVGPLRAALPRPWRAAGPAAPSAVAAPDDDGGGGGAAPSRSDHPVGLPYGVAVAVGGLAVLHRILGL